MSDSDLLTTKGDVTIDRRQDYVSITLLAKGQSDMEKRVGKIEKKVDKMTDSIHKSDIKRTEEHSVLSTQVSGIAKSIESFPTEFKKLSSRVDKQGNQISFFKWVCIGILSFVTGLTHAVIASLL